MAPITIEVAGPANAIWNSCPGVFISPSTFEAPPKMNRVIEGTVIPWCSATKACDSSCSRTERKKIAAAANPASQRSADDSSGTSPATSPCSRHATRTKTNSHDQWTRIAIPRTRPMTMPLRRSIVRWYPVASGLDRRGG